MRNLYRAPKSATNVYRGYIPIDLPQHQPPNRIKPWWRVVGKPRVNYYPKPVIEGYSETPEYPKLNDGSIEGLKTQVRLDWYERLKSLPTVDEKLSELGQQEFHYIAHINNWMPGYDSLPMAQYLTQTKLIDSLPNNYSISTSTALNDELFSKLKQILLDQIALAKYQSIEGNPGFVSRPARDGNQFAYKSNLFIQNLVSGIKRALAMEINPDLIGYQQDLSPALRSWWYHSGFKPPNQKIFYKSRKDSEGCINQIIQADGSAALNLRSVSMIAPIVSQTDPIVTDVTSVEKYCYPLKSYGARFEFKSIVTLPGYWYDAKSRFNFPHTTFLSMDALSLRNRPNRLNVKDLDDVENCLDSQAILTAFSWLNSLSMYHGFTVFHELEYPFTCQIVTTDGKNWMFHVYQMNSHTFHRDLGGPKKNNLCWSSGKMQLYDDYRDGHFIGLNDNVVKLLIRFMAQKSDPEFTAQLINLSPLKPDTRLDEDIANTKLFVRRRFEYRPNRWLRNDWRVPEYEHIFFRSKTHRNTLTHMKARWHVPKPKYPKHFL